METQRPNSLRTQLIAWLLFFPWAAPLAFGHNASVHEAKLYQLSKFQRFDLASLKGKKFVLVFFQPDCPPCREQMKALKCLKEKFKKVEVVAVGVGEQPALAKEVRPLALNYPALESTPKFQALVDGVTSTPSTLYVDEQGHITSREEGTRSCEDWEKVAKSKVLF